MPDRKISALPNAGPLDGSEFVPIDQAGATAKTTTQAVADLAGALWEVALSTGGALGFIEPVAARTDGGDNSINGAYLGQFERDDAGTLYKAYLQVTPGSNGPGRGVADGNDIQASAWIDGSLNTMDWYFWSRPRSGGFEAGTFFDAIADDGAAHQPEAYVETFASPTALDWFAFIQTDRGASGALIGLFNDTDDVCYVYFEDDGGAYLRFAQQGGGNAFPIAPDAQLALGDWSIGTGGGGIDLIYKINDAGTIKTLNLGTPT